MAGIAELLFVPATVMQRLRLGEEIEAGLRLIDKKTLVEDKSAFIQFSRGGDGPCMACGLGLGLIGMLGLERVREIASRTGYRMMRDEVVELLGCGERLGMDVSNAHLNLGMKARDISRALRDGQALA